MVFAHVKHSWWEAGWSMWGFTKLFRDLGWQRFYSLNPMASEVTLYVPPRPPIPHQRQTRKRRWEQRERFLWAGVQSDDILPSHLGPLARTQCCGHTTCPGQLHVCPAEWGAWTGCGHLPLHCFHSNSKPEFTQRGVCLFLRLMTVNNLRQEGRRQGAIAKSLLKVWHNCREQVTTKTS